MTLMEAPRLYPVYTWHADEVLEVIRRVEELIRQKAGWSEKDKMYRFFTDLKKRLDVLLYELRSASGSIAYVDRENRELVEKAVGWLKDNPKDRTA